MAPTGLTLNRVAASGRFSRRFPCIFSFNLNPLVQVTGLLNNGAKIPMQVCLSWVTTRLLIIIYFLLGKWNARRWKLLRKEEESGTRNSGFKRGENRA